MPPEKKGTLPRAKNASTGRIFAAAALSPPFRVPPQISKNRAPPKGCPVFWCNKAIQIRTVFVADSFRQFRKGDGFCALLVVEGDHHFIIVRENRVDEGVNEHLAVAFLPHVQLAEAVEPEGYKLGTDLGLRQLFAGKPVLKLVAAVFQFLLRSFWRRIKSSSLSEQALENFRIVW